jgi:hypothetical protein
VTELSTHRCFLDFCFAAANNADVTGHDASQIQLWGEEGDIRKRNTTTKMIIKKAKEYASPSKKTKGASSNTRTATSIDIFELYDSPMIPSGMGDATATSAATATQSV